MNETFVPTAGWVVAGTAIYSTGSTARDAYRRYVAETGDDAATLGELESRHHADGQTHLTRASRALLFAVEHKGGALAFSYDAFGTACLPHELTKEAA